MFSWLSGKPRCPIRREEKDWIESRFSWLTEQFGIQRLRSSTIVLPTADFWPEEYDGTENELHDLMCRVAFFMQIDPETLELGFYEEGHQPFEPVSSHRSVEDSTRTEERFLVSLDGGSIHDPVSVATTLIHELGHVLLVGQNRLSIDDEDHELVTDLLAVFLGLGILPANTVIYESYWNEGHMSGWKISKRGYLSMDMFGYALALFTLARSEPNPSWATFLRPDVRKALKQAIRYIQETSDCSYQPANVSSKPPQ